MANVASSPDGKTAYIVTGPGNGAVVPARLFAVDVATGKILTQMSWTSCWIRHLEVDHDGTIYTTCLPVKPLAGTTLLQIQFDGKSKFTVARQTKVAGNG